MKAEPPLLPAMYGNFQMAPKPTAEPALAKIKPKREPHVERSLEACMTNFPFLVACECTSSDRPSVKGCTPKLLLFSCVMNEG